MALFQTFMKEGRGTTGTVVNKKAVVDCIGTKFVVLEVERENSFEKSYEVIDKKDIDHIGVGPWRYSRLEAVKAARESTKENIKNYNKWLDGAKSKLKVINEYITTERPPLPEVPPKKTATKKKMPKKKV